MKVVHDLRTAVKRQSHPLELLVMKQPTIVIHRIVSKGRSECNYDFFHSNFLIIFRNRLLISYLQTERFRKSNHNKLLFGHVLDSSQNRIERIPFLNLGLKALKVELKEFLI